MRYILIALLFVGCANEKPEESSKYRIEQQYRSTSAASILCNNRNGCIETYGWMNEDIVWSAYDNPETITDSIADLRIKQAQEFIDKIKKYDR